MAEAEQRTNRRVSTEMSLRYRVVDGEGELAKHYRTQTTNVAAGGFAFLTKFILPMGCRIEVEISLAGQKGLLKCEAIVVRIVGEFVEGKDIEYGAAFDIDTIENQEALGAFVRSVDIVPLLQRMSTEGATDLHLSANTPPVYRIRQRLVPAGAPLSGEVVEALVKGTMNSARRERFEKDKELYFPFVLPGIGRWHGSVFSQRGNIEATFQPMEEYVPSVAELGLPEIVRGLALGDGGLILVTGGSRSGKSTTLASMIRAINYETEKVIVTIEDPIQYIHTNNKSLIKQREVGTDTHSVADGLKNILRQDADVIMADDVPNSGVMDMLFRAAETRRLVMTSLPSADAGSAIRRILGMYREDRKPQVLHQISGVLRGIISQRLVRSVDGSEMV